jgi:uncharacterized repeat protein (TIGR01451 family)
MKSKTMFGCLMAVVMALAFCWPAAAAPIAPDPSGQFNFPPAPGSNNYGYIDSYNSEGPRWHYIDLEWTGVPIMWDPGCADPQDDCGGTICLGPNPYDDPVTCAANALVPFSIYNSGQVYSLKVSTNGFLTTDLADPDNKPGYVCPPTADAVLPTPAGFFGERIYALFQDLYVNPPGGVYYQYFAAGTCPLDAYSGTNEACSIFNWKNISSYDAFNDGLPSEHFSFDVVLFHPSNEIRYLYNSIDVQTGLEYLVGVSDGDECIAQVEILGDAIGNDDGVCDLFEDCYAQCCSTEYSQLTYNCDDPANLYNLTAITWLPPETYTIPDYAGDVSVVKNTTTPSGLFWGEPITFTVGISNAGPHTQTNVIISDTIPMIVPPLPLTPMSLYVDPSDLVSHVQCTQAIVSITLAEVDTDLLGNNDGVCEFANGEQCTISVNVGDVASGGTVDCDIIALVPDLPDDPLNPWTTQECMLPITDNVVTVTADLCDPNPGNNSSSVSIFAGYFIVKDPSFEIGNPPPDLSVVDPTLAPWNTIYAFGIPSYAWPAWWGTLLDGATTAYPPWRSFDNTGAEEMRLDLMNLLAGTAAWDVGYPNVGMIFDMRVNLYYPTAAICTASNNHPLFPDPTVEVLQNADGNEDGVCDGGEICGNFMQQYVAGGFNHFVDWQCVTNNPISFNAPGCDPQLPAGPNTTVSDPIYLADNFFMQTGGACQIYDYNELRTMVTLPDLDETANPCGAPSAELSFYVWLSNETKQNVPMPIPDCVRIFLNNDDGAGPSLDDVSRVQIYEECQYQPTMKQSRYGTEVLGDAIGDEDGICDGGEACSDPAGYRKITVPANVLAPYTDGRNYELIVAAEVFGSNPSYSTINVDDVYINIRCGGYCADLEVDKTAAPDDDANGEYDYHETVSYTITITNHGPQAQEGVHMEDVIPVGLEYVTSSASCSKGAIVYAGGTLYASIDDMAVDEVVTCTYQARVIDCLNLENSVTVNGAINDPDMSNNVASIDLDGPECYADLEVTKVFDLDAIEWGSTAQITLTATNLGEMPDTNIIVTDTIPAGLIYVSDTCGAIVTLPTDPALSATTVEWNIAELAPATSPDPMDVSTLTCVVTVRGYHTGVLPDPVCGPRTNTVTIVGDELYGPDPGTGNNDDSDCIDVTHCWGDLTIEKFVDNDNDGVADAPMTWGYGDEVAFRLLVENLGPMDQTGVVVTDVLPAGLEYTGTDCCEDCGYFFNGTFYIELGDFDGTYDHMWSPQPGEQLMGKDCFGNTIPGCRIFAKVVDCADPTDNTAEVWGDIVEYMNVMGCTDVIEIDETGNNTSTYSMDMDCVVDLEITKTADDYGPVGEGNLVTYTITVTNLDDAYDWPAEGVTVTDNIPAGMDLVEITCDGTLAGDVFTWNIGTLMDGETATCTIRVRVAGCADTYENTATITNGDTNLTDSNDSDSVTVTANCETELDLAKTADDTTVISGQIVTYTLSVSNLNTDWPAQDVVVTDNIPTGLELIETTCDGVLSPAGFTWNVGTLYAAAPATCTIQVRVAQCSPTYVNIAETTASTWSGSDDETVTLTTDCVTPLELEKTSDDSDGELVKNQILTYTLRVTNLSDEWPAAGVWVEDTIPYGMELVETTCNGELDGDTFWWNVGSLGMLESETCTIRVKVVDCMATYENEAFAYADTWGGSAGDSLTLTADCVTPLTLVKISDPTEGAYLSYGQEVTYTLTVSNTNMDWPALGVSVEDMIPDGMDLVETTCNGVLSAGGFTWNVGTLVYGDPQTCTILVKAMECRASYTNDAGATAATWSGEAEDDVTLYGDCPTPLTLVKESYPAEGSFLTDGQLVTYTITVTNTNDEWPAYGVVVTDTIPAGMDLVETTCGGVVAGDTFTWNVGTLAADSSAACTVQVVAADCMATYLNQAAATATTWSGTASDSVTLYANCVTDVTISKTDDDADDVVEYGQTVNYTISVTNTNSAWDTAVPVVVTDNIPAGMELVEATCGGTFAGTTFTWNVGIMEAGASATCNILVKATGCQATYTNTATITQGDNASSDVDSASRTLTAVCSTPLDVTKVGNVTPGAYLSLDDEVTYTVTVTNLNTAWPAQGVRTVDNVPAGMELLETTCRGTENGDTVTWVIGTLDKGASATCTVRLAATECQPTYTNNVTATATTWTGSHSASVTYRGDCTLDLAISKTADATEVVFGQLVTYTIDVTNTNGDWPAYDVAVHEGIPAGMELVETTCNGVLGGGFHWNVGQLNPSETATCTMLVKVVGCEPSYVNTATIASGDTAGGDSNDSDSVTLYPADDCTTDVSIAKTSNGAAPISYGETFTYTITVANNGVWPAGNVVVADTLPAGLTYVESTCSAFYMAGSNWNIGTLGVGESVQCQVTVTATGCATGNTYVNTATVSASNDGTSGNNSSTVSLAADACGTDVSITKTTDAVAPVGYGDVFNFTITVTNGGLWPASGVVVTDNLPAGLDYQESTCSAFFNSGLTWNVGTLMKGQTMTCVVKVMADECPTGAVYSNTATVAVASPTDVNTSNNSATRTVGTDACNADLAIDKVGTARNVAYGDNFGYLLTVTNNGPWPTHAVVTDQVPEGLDYIAGNCGSLDEDDELMWHAGMLAPGAKVSCEFYVTADTCGSVTNSASVTGSLTDASASNNTDSWTVTIGSCPADLSISKYASPTSADYGQVVSFTVTVTNNGPFTSEEVVATDLLGYGLEFVSTTCGSYSGGIITWNVGDMLSGQNASCSISARVVACGNLINMASVSGSSFDPHWRNNNATAVVTGNNCQGDLSISKYSDGEAEYRGVFTYTLTVSNSGPMDQEGVFVNDILSSGLEFVSASCSVVSNDGIVIWDVGSLASGSNASCVLTVRRNSCDAQSNIAQVHGEMEDLNGTNDTASAAIDACAADFSADGSDISKWSVVKGSFQPTTDGDDLESRGEGTNLALVKNVTFGDGVLKMDVYPRRIRTNRYTTEKANGGFVFAYQSPKNYKYARIYGSKIEIGSVTAGKRTVIATKRYVGIRDWTKMEVVIEGTSVKVIMDKSTASFTADFGTVGAKTRQMEGQVGVWAVDYRTYFDNFEGFAWEGPM